MKYIYTSCSPAVHVNVNVSIFEGSDILSFDVPGRLLLCQ